MSIERYLRLPSDKVELESYVRSIMQQPSNLLTAALNFSNVHYSTALEYVYPTRTLSDQRATAQASVQYESQHPSHSHEADQDRNGQSSDSSFDSSSTASSSSRTREAGSTQGGQFQEAQVRSQSTPRPASSPQPKYPKTVFEAGMPGALSIAEVEQQIDLAGWPTAIGEHMTTLEVRHPLFVSLVVLLYFGLCLPFSPFFLPSSFALSIIPPTRPKPETAPHQLPTSFLQHTSSYQIPNPPLSQPTESRRLRSRTNHSPALHPWHSSRISSLYRAGPRRTTCPCG